MSATAEHPQPAADPHGDGAHGHDGHDHGPFFAHHFESWKQQFDAGKLGMWAFLVQEVLFFSGLFCFYAIYRALRPEVFEYADQFLSVPHGFFNTIVLLFSSLTMAWGVRCAMLGQRTGLIACLAVTLACAALFLGVKAYEYSEKYHAQLIWAGADPRLERTGPELEKVVGRLDPKSILEGPALEKAFTATLHRIELILGVAALVFLVAAGAVYATARARVGLWVTFAALALSAAAVVVGAESSLFIHGWVHGGHHAESHADAGHGGAAHAGEGHDEAAPHEPGHGGEVIETARTEKAGVGNVVTDAVFGPPVGSGDTLEMERAASLSAPLPAAEEGALPGEVVGAEPGSGRPQYLGTFFSVYYMLTGVHALHILGGMGVLTWLLVRSVRGDFTPEYFGPVDFVGLYWHLVDLVWIYLFPLLYLIG